LTCVLRVANKNNFFQGLTAIPSSDEVHTWSKWNTKVTMAKEIVQCHTLNNSWQFRLLLKAKTSSLKKSVDTGVAFSGKVGQ